MMLDVLKQMVQHNCDIADAKHAQSYSMCTYLMKMREYFRWEQGYLFTDDLPKQDLGEWIKQREQTWEGLEDIPYQSLLINNQRIDPFDTQNINALLRPNNWLYSAGVGRYGCAHFFLGNLVKVVEKPGFVVYYTDQEFARDLISPPAMLQGNHIFIRKESYKRLIWEKIQEWRWLRNKDSTSMGKVLQAYQYDIDSMQALEDIAIGELDTILWHEMGEWYTRQTLGNAWLDMMQQLVAQQENIARSVKDLLADCYHTLPNLLEKNQPASIHLYFSQLQSTRKMIFPMLVEAYREWQETNSTRTLHASVSKGSEHWMDVAKKMIQQVKANQLEKDPETLMTQIRL